MNISTRTLQYMSSSYTTYGQSAVATSTLWASLVQLSCVPTLKFIAHVFLLDLPPELLNQMQHSPRNETHHATSDHGKNRIGMSPCLKITSLKSHQHHLRVSPSIPYIIHNVTFLIMLRAIYEKVCFRHEGHWEVSGIVHTHDVQLTWTEREKLDHGEGS